NDAARRDLTNQGPARSVPNVHDLDACTAHGWFERPLHVHSTCNTANMPESDCRPCVVVRPRDRHQGRPPGWPAGSAEWPIGGHLDEPAAVAPLFMKSDEPVVGQMLRPLLDVGG